MRPKQIMLSTVLNLNPICVTLDTLSMAFGLEYYKISGMKKGMDFD